MNYDLRSLMLGEVLVTIFVVFVIYGRRATTRLLFQRRRSAMLKTGGLPASAAARPGRGTDVWEDLASDSELLLANQVTRSELLSLKHASLMGSVANKEDLLFILQTIRGPVRKPTGGRSNKNQSV